MTNEKIKELIAQMTLEEKAGLCSGEDFWHTKAVKRLDIPAIMVSDGPHGLRKQDQSADHLGVNESIKAVCFPAGCATASSFDRELVEDMGKTLGNECQAEDVSVLLGPAINMKRSPLCGRNFEYYSEDPYLAGQISTSFVKGVQSQGVGTSVKHFAANSQEHRRMTSSSEVDERTMHEIYLPAFEETVKQANPWTIMCSYNKINGVYASENEEYLTNVLRKKWGYEGFVMSDWGAVNDRVEGLKAGLELEMPSSGGINDKKIVQAVENNTLQESVLDEAVLRLLRIVFKAKEEKKQTSVFERENDHEKARKVEEESAVLLKNDAILPLKESEKIAFLGTYAKTPRYQGGGSSHINSSRVTGILDCLKEDMQYRYAKGFDDKEDSIDERLVEEALAAAKWADVSVIFAGLPDSFESEGYDRDHMSMPNCQNDFIERVAKVNKNCVVVLHNGSSVEMPWINQVKGVLELYLGGQAVGAAAYDILFGHVNPSGRLPETFPKKLSDNPSYLSYKGEGDIVEYKEGIFIGYRYYDKKEADVLFPFGHGLSYTSFAYSNLKLDKAKLNAKELLTVTVDVTNTGKVQGKEVVQLYVGQREAKVIRPVKELRDFAKISLKPGETKTVTFTLNERAFSYYDVTLHDFYAPEGTYDIMIAKSAKEVVLSESITLFNDLKLQKSYSSNSTFGDVMEEKEGRNILKPYIDKMGIFSDESTEAEAEAISSQMQDAMLKDLPLRALISFSSGAVSLEDLDTILEKLKQQ